MLDQSMKKIEGTEVSRICGDRTLTACRYNPYGLYYLTVSEGTLPEKFTGAYTTLEALDVAMNSFQEEYKPEKKKLKGA